MDFMAVAFPAVITSLATANKRLYLIVYQVLTFKYYNFPSPENYFSVQYDINLSISIISEAPHNTTMNELVVSVFIVFHYLIL